MPGVAVDGPGEAAGSAVLTLVTEATPLSPGPALFEAMLEGWRRQQAARRLTGALIDGRERVIRRFGTFTGGLPWQWTPGQVETWIAEGGWAHSTIRSYQGAVALFLAYACDPRYGWVAECEQQVGARPVQIVHEWNTAVHVAGYEGRPGRRPLTRAELQAFFDTADDHVEAQAAGRSKGWLASFRDATLFKVIYGWGLRRREAVMLDVADFTANPAAAELGRFGMLHVRYGKAMKGSPPRRRAVATVMPWPAQAVEQYLEQVRPRYGWENHPAAWLTERGGRISLRQVDDRFAAFRMAAGLPDDLSVHCLRHSYISHLIEDGVDPLFVQYQAGHSWASTTAAYTTVGADARNRMLQAALARVFHQAGEQR
jgi:site-specific recombinase XerD